jgi:holliday junction DNA helicase RuvA
MFGFIEGRFRRPDILITDNGVGYKVAGICDFEEGNIYSLLIHTAVRENAITLYGFKHETELALFERIIKINGVGPKVALAILKDVGVVAAVAAIRNNTPSALQTAKGLGKKGAENIVRGLTLDVETFGETALATVEEPKAPVVVAAVTALVSLGYGPQARVESVVQQLFEDGNKEEVILVRSSIGELS